MPSSHVCRHWGTLKRLHLIVKSALLKERVMTKRMGGCEIVSVCISVCLSICTQYIIVEVGLGDNGASECVKSHD